MAETERLAAIAAARIGEYERGRAATTATRLGHHPRSVELPVNHLNLDQRVQADRKPRRQVAHPLERPQHAGDERLSRRRVVAERQHFPRPAEDHLLMPDE